MKLVIRPKPRPTGEDNPKVIESVAALVLEGRPITARQIAKALHLDEAAVTRIIHKRFQLGKPGPAGSRQLAMEWSPISGDPSRLQETLYTLRKEADVVEVD